MASYKLACALAFLALQFSVSGLHAQDTSTVYPAKPVRVILTFPAGGGVDVIARTLAQKLTESTGQQFVVDNRPGAGGIVAADLVAKSAPDGYTLGLVTGGHAISGALYNSLPYQPVDSFEMISTVVYYALVIAVRADYPAKTLGELIALAKKNPGEHTYATGGNGSVQHIAMEMFTRAAGIQMRHIPYKGVTPALTDVLGNQVSMMFAGFPPAMVHVQSGKLVALGMSTKDRLRAAPEIPSVSETPGIENYDLPVWVALFAPSGTPAVVLDRLHRETASIFATPAIRANIEKAGMTVSDESRATFTAFVKSENAKYRKIIKDAGIKEE